MMIPTNRNVSNLQLTLIFKITLLFHTHFQKTPLNYLVIFVFDSLAALNFPCSRKYMKKQPFQEKAKWVKTIKLTKLNKTQKILLLQENKTTRVLFFEELVYHTF